MANVHPWFSGTSIQDAARWTFNYFNETNVYVASVYAATALANKPQMYIGETGWPTSSLITEEKTKASEPYLQIFIDRFVCTANSQGVKYFLHEFTDIPWKQLVLYAGTDGFGGLFNSNKTLKALTLPDCSHD